MKRLLRAMALPLMLLLCACPKINPDNPDNPDTPTAPYFSLKTETGGEVPDILVFDYMGGGTIYALKVDTNVEGWTATGDADWCMVMTGPGEIRFSLQTYEEANSQLYPRRCQVHIAAPGVFDRTLTIGQESVSRFLYTVPDYKNEFDLPASGAPIDITVVSNLVEWTIVNNNDWIKAEKVDRITLRVSAVPSETEKGRTGEVTLVSIANDNQASVGTYWTMFFHEEESGVSGDDYSYGDGIEWD